jgi:carboxyl-terminal processing protease
MKKIIKIAVLPAILLISVAAAGIQYDRLFEISKNIEIFVNAFRELNKHYVDDLDPATVMRTGLDAVVGSLDPYTNFISESQVESYRISEDGRYQGIGASGVAIEGNVYLREVFEEGPAHSAGLRAGDMIKSINGTPTEGLGTEEVGNLMRGVAGTPVRLEVIKLGNKDTEFLTVERGEINIPNVPYSGWLSEDVGYVSLTTFTQNAASNISQAMKKLKAENPNIKGLVLDLRDNGGGLLREAVSISNLFVPQGIEVVTTKGKDLSKSQNYITLTPPQDIEIPLAVMINRRSASASEIVSGVIQDLDRGVIIGQRSFGKGLVQSYYEIGYNNRLKITISKYYIPSGRCIQGVEYADGEPVDIPDELRSEFKTRNGRIVLDGGGVTPDIRLEEPELAPVTKALLDQHIIFKYANEYVLSKDSIRDVESFNFNLYDEFLKFVEKQKFSYEIDGEKELRQLVESLEKTRNAPAVKAEIEQIKNKIVQHKKEDFQRHKEEIVFEIEKELITRYFFQKGLTKIRLRKDKETNEAISVLSDQKIYKQILKKA